MTFRRGRAALAALLLSTVFLPAAGASPALAANAAPDGTDTQSAMSATGSYLAGRFAQHQDDWSNAARFTAQALSADPDDVPMLNRTFLLTLNEGRMEEALAYARRLAGGGRDAQLAVTLLTVDALAHGKTEEATAMAARMPKDGMGRYVGPLVDAWLAVAHGKTDDALAALIPLAQTHGFEALYNLQVGLIQELGGRADEAAKQYAKVVDQDAPLRVIQIVGSFDERHGHRDEARKLYQDFREANPDNRMVDPALAALDAGKTAAPVITDARQGLAEAMFDLGSALHHEGADETALLFGRIALHLRPDLALARLMVADILQDHDHKPQALADYQALEKDPVLGWTARLRAADTLAQQGGNDEARALLTKMATERPDGTDALIRLGDLDRTMERYAEAADAYSKALDRIGKPDERHWAVLYARAMAYEKTDRWPDAERDLKAALALKPEEPYLLNYLGYSWVDRGINLPQAKDMIEKAVSLRPKDGYIIDSLGWVLYRAGDYEGAVAKLERAVELKPNDATINDHLGDAYWQAGRRNEARFQWRQALRSAEDPAQREQIRAKLDKGLTERKAAEADGHKVR